MMLEQHCGPDPECLVELVTWHAAVFDGHVCLYVRSNKTKARDLPVPSLLFQDVAMRSLAFVGSLVRVPCSHRVSCRVARIKGD